MKDFHKIAVNEGGILVENPTLYSSFKDAVSFLKENRETYKGKEIYIVCIVDGVPVSGSQFHYSVHG